MYVAEVDIAEVYASGAIAVHANKRMDCNRIKRCRQGTRFGRCCSEESVMKCRRKCTARSDRGQDEGPGMKASECSLGNECLGTEPRE